MAPPVWAIKEKKDEERSVDGVSFLKRARCLVKRKKREEKDEVRAREKERERKRGGKGAKKKRRGLLALRSRPTVRRQKRIFVIP